MQVVDYVFAQTKARVDELKAKCDDGSFVFVDVARAEYTGKRMTIAHTSWRKRKRSRRAC